MRHFIAAAIVTGSLAAAACAEARGEDAGPTVARNYQVGTFNAVEVGGPYQVEVRTGANASVSGRGTQALMDRTIVEVRDGRLIIRPREERWSMNFGRNRENAQFTVTVPQLRAAAIGGSGSIRVDRVQGDSFDGDIGGSGSITVGSTNVRSLKLSIGGSGSVHPGSGSAQSADYDIAGSGEIDAGQVQIRQAKVSVAGSGSVRGHVTERADVDIAGSGDVNLTGGGRCSVNKAGSGRARCS